MTRIQCPKCGKINDDSLDFCIYCGTIYDEYKPEENSDLLSVKSMIPFENGAFRQKNDDFNQIPNKPKNKHTLAIILGYIFAILGGLLGFVFAIYLLTRDDSVAKKHGLVQLLVLLAYLLMISVLILTGQMDMNVLLNPFNTTQVSNLTNMSNMSSLFGI
ncbi:zinc ribbon domain-containing protein [Methanobrevibacter olleyae]|uniref:Zinc-ribbon domain-containing protein n=1 Tax=Methanobrevibacter olleyae TaxID=294671 RepID=A0A126R054_METOL|nr:zinc ribbon domain-containing protein [Methanobrevibacter olleyae]AMK15444.1 hypothetical protein YLM1_0887 [Methanobrevibacter olleyae]SFL56319.1 zinc-ribbon domain-containing protein [Methanobrevibacter olleyae]